MGEPRSLEDRQAIVDVCVRYAIALDTRDWDLLRKCFTGDAIARYEGRGDSQGYDAIEQTCRAALLPLTASQHLLGNHLVSIDGDCASSICYFQAQHVKRGVPGGTTLIVAGRYDDRFVRTGTGWRISERALTVSWTSGNESLLGGGPDEAAAPSPGHNSS